MCGLGTPLGDAYRREIQVDAFLSGAHIAVVEILHRLAHAIAGIFGAGAVILP